MILADFALAKIDITEFGARGPLRREHVLYAGSYGPADFRLVLNQREEDAASFERVKAVVHVAERRPASEIEQR